MDHDSKANYVGGTLNSAYNYGLLLGVHYIFGIIINIIIIIFLNVGMLRVSVNIVDSSLQPVGLNHSDISDHISQIRWLHYFH